MGTKGIYILLVNEDIACRNIVSEMLQHCSYEGLYIKHASDVVNAIRERKDSIEQVLTNAHRFGSEWDKFAKNIQREFNLPVMLMKPDEVDVHAEGQEYSFSAYILKGLSKNEVNIRWKSAIEKVKQKLTINQQENSQILENVKPLSLISEPSKHKTTEMEKTEGNKEEDLKRKKQRVVWSSEMHQKFVEVIDALGGPENAVPKKIVEKMGVEGLTRENVASHLQKHRGGRKRAEEILKAASHSATSSRNEFNNASFFLPPDSGSRINSSQRSSYYTQNNGFNNLYFQSSYIPQNRTYSKMQNKLPIYNYSEQKHYVCMGTSQSRNTNFDDFEQKYIPQVQLNGRFKIYNDQKKNMLFSISNNNNQSDNSSKFVGYRLTNNGNSIDFGGISESSVKDDMCFVQPNRLDDPSLPCFHSQDETEYLVQSLWDTINESYDILPNEVTGAQNEVPLWNISMNEIQLQDLTELENLVDTSSSTYVPDQDFLLAEPQTTILQEHSHFLDQMGIDSLEMNETMTVSPKFEWEEFDDTIFDYGA